MLTVCCVKWGDRYGANYVTRLESMCRRHLPPHNFVCLTENPVDGVNCHPLPSTLGGWWAKVGMFRAGMFEGDVLYFDLDVVLTENLHGMVELLETDRSHLWAPDDFSYSIVKPKQGLSREMKLTLGGDGTINSSVMMWHGDNCREVWEKFDVSVMETMHGDQNFITATLWPRINIIPSEWVKSYKYNNRQPGPVSVFHGDPKPPEAREKWVKDHWR